jgi:hypothetical protein
MRKVLVYLALFLTTSTAAAIADPHWTMAPADEYFGRFKQSILEIRNRLDALDFRDERAMLSPDVIGSLDRLQETIADWQRKYPRDPWIPRYVAHLMHEYARAHGLSSGHAREASRMVAGLRY